jgi:isopenicillin-N N-acyltransferase like protein
LDASYTRLWGGIREVYLEGSPEQLGAAHSRLLYDHMVHNEGELWGTFEHFVPVGFARALIMDTSRVQYRHVDVGIPAARKQELAAEALGLSPDPFDGKMATYQRLVFLHAVYDIALSFEHSPLIGCSAFGLGASVTKDGHVLVGRAFDFEAGEVFDTDKAVFFVRENGAIPYASVAWPGMTGVLTGLNEQGVMILVNGGRARDPRTEGIPVVFSLREVMQNAHDTNEAVEILKKQDVMVSHIVFVADAKGKFAVVERAPGEKAFVRDTFADPDRADVTNHFEGTFADDPKNQAVRANTTTLPRRARLDEMLTALSPKSADANTVVDMLRDHQCAGGQACALGDRRQIDALIATHGVVADTTDRVLWVSRGPHLSGAFVRFDLKTIFAKDHDPAKDGEAQIIAEDPILKDGRYEEGRKHAGGPKVGGDKP